MPPKMTIAGVPSFLLGVNYWSRVGGPRMWDRFDADRVRAELSQMRGIGLNVCRSFAFIPSFMPRPGTIASKPLDRLRHFLDLCQREQMHTIPTALVGHMSGENHDFKGQDHRSLYSDPELIGWQEQLVAAMAKAGADHPAVIAYLASNEMPLWGGHASPATIAVWAKRLRDAASLEDPRRPFGLGDGVMNLKGGNNGFDVGALRDIVDFFGPHTYYSDSDPYRQALNGEFCVRSLTHLGVPVLFEEFGCSSAQASEENQAHYYRELLHGCLSAGATGALGWCFSDFDLVDEPPYAHHAFELGFGITRADGSEKPVCGELRALSSLVEAIDYPTLQHPEPQATIIVPSYFNTTYPFSREDRARMRRTLLQAYVLCVKAGIEAEFVPEQADLSRYRLLLAPSTQKLLAPTWRTLRERARAGATVYWSYFGGDYPFHQGAWCQDFAELTGCHHRLRYACYDLPPPALKLSGAALSIDVETNIGGQPYPRAFLPIDPHDGTDVLARDGAERPAIVRARHDAGSVVFCNYPLEYYLAEQSDINARDDTEQLYRLLATQAGLDRAVRSDNPAVQARVVGSGNGSSLLWLINHGWDATEAAVDSPGGTRLYGSQQPLAPGRASVALDGKQVAVYRLEPLK